MRGSTLDARNLVDRHRAAQNNTFSLSTVTLFFKFLPLTTNINWKKLIMYSHLITYLFTYSMNQGLSHLVKKFPAFHRTRRFITFFTKALHLSLSWLRSIQFMHPSYFLKSHLNIILSSTPGYSSLFFPSCLPTKTLYAPPLTPYVLHDPSIFILFDLITRITFGEEYRSVFNVFYWY